MTRNTPVTNHDEPLMAADEFWRGYPRGWDTDPRYVPPAITPFGSGRHIPTGILAVAYSVRGGWSYVGVEAVREALRRVLPGAHVCRIVEGGLVRVTIYLGHDTSYALDVRPDRRSRLDPSFDASAWAFDHAVAVETGRPARNAPAPRLPAPEPAVTEALAWAEGQLRGKGLLFPPRVFSPEDTWVDLETATGIRLRESYFHWSTPEG